MDARAVVRELRADGRLEAPRASQQWRRADQEISHSVDQIAGHLAIPSALLTRWQDGPEAAAPFTAIAKSIARRISSEILEDDARARLQDESRFAVEVEDFDEQL